jgi:hypothetical protein
MIKNITSARSLPGLPEQVFQTFRTASFNTGALLLAALLLPLIFSCAGGPRFNSAPVPAAPAGNPALTVPATPAQLPPENPPGPGAGAALEEASPALASAARPEAVHQANPVQPSPEKPLIPPLPVYIMGEGLTGSENLVKFLLDSNPKAEGSFVLDLAAGYIKEAAAEGVNHDVAFAQMCLETGFLRYGGLVTPDMNNFCGLGAIGPGKNGERFPDAPTGIRAHIQHLKAYATEEPLKQELVDPRYFWVRYGSSPKIEGLAGTWAADTQYAVKLVNILERLYRFSFHRP